MQMKKYLVLIMLVLMACTTIDSIAQKHRHDPQLLAGRKADTTVVVADSSKNVPVAEPSAADTAGIEAFSDTTSVASNQSVVSNGDDWDDDDDIREFNRAWDDFKINLPFLGIGGGVMAALAIILLLFLSLAPFILFGFIVWVILKNRNQRYKLAEKAMEQGQQIPEPLLKDTTKTNKDLWSRGIRNVFLGIGLAVFFMCWDARFLSGLGWLLCFYGVGQAVIAKTTKKDDDLNNPMPPSSRDYR